MRRGLAVVSVRNGTCQGCNMNIPPQLYNVLQRGVTVETCPSCHRIIYWEEIMKDDGRPARAAGTSSRRGRMSPDRARERPVRAILSALLARAGQVVAAALRAPSRKVRAPQGRVLANGQSR